MELTQQRRENGDCVDFFGRDLHGAADASGMRRGGVGESLQGHFHRFRPTEQIVALGRQRVAGLALLEEVDAERLLHRRDSPRHRRLAGAQQLRGRERAALASDGEEIFEVVPVEHRRHI